MFTSEGVLKYSITPLHSYKLILEIDSEIVKYYRAFIPKSIKVNKPKYNSHISVVRKEVPVYLEYWGKYQDKVVRFEYENIINFGTMYCWLDVYCQFLIDLRLELGLSRSRWIDTDLFHITIANTKKLV